ncbi:PH domain-containing protein [Taibaiella koreensis]|uniref:PH domain-containing protein n=1 Tax=Taibaiella koreensis TaxID=1268548 RepID=UPI000E59F50E|nr:PH domain-containing protein [Taibaiella koreensis]
MSQISQNSLDLHNAGEQIVWKGKSSQLLNAKHYALALLVAAVSIWAALHFDSNYLLLGCLAAVVYALCYFMILNAASYTLTNQRIIRRAGVLNRTTYEIELYRVKDVHLFEPLQLRLFGLGNISLISSQRSTQLFAIKAVSQATALREQLRHLVETRRNEKGVGEYDTN